MEAEGNHQVEFCGRVVDLVRLLEQVQHARVGWTYGPLGKLLVSPAFHRFHHSRRRKDFDHNFGSRLVLWDWLFGTYSPRTLSPDEIGVDGNTYAERPLLAEFFRPYYQFCTSAAAACEACGPCRCPCAGPPTSAGPIECPTACPLARSSHSGGVIREARPGPTAVARQI